MAWHSEVIPLLKEGNYQAIIEYYENQISRESDNISLYWYLGLAYLLCEQTAEALGIWLSVFSEGDEVSLEVWTTELVTILETEATNQSKLENYQLAKLIRQQIIELNPTNLENLLRLVELEILLKTYQTNQLTELKVIELLAQSEPGEINSDLVLQVLNKVLQYPSYASVNFARAALKSHQDKEVTLRLINEIAQEMAYEKNWVSYAVDLNTILQEQQPDDLVYFNLRFWYLKKLNKMEEAISTAEEYRRLAKNILSQAYASYLLIHAHMRESNWTKVMEVVQEHKRLIQEMSLEKSLFFPSDAKNDFILVGQILMYIEDNPRENRPLFNEISRLFQNISLQSMGNPQLLEPQPPHPPHQRLRIGYIASTLKRHSVGWLSRWLFQHHDREQFEIFIYLVNQSETEFTKTWFTPYADQVHSFYRNPPGLIKQIKADEIDILIDLDSLTLNLTCMVMSCKPAPIQATWLGLDASGIPAIDYFIADPYVLPNDAQDYYSETIWRLPQTYLAVDGFEIGIPDIRRDTLDIPPDAVIFLNIQNAVKRHPHTLDLQMQIIQAVPNSYFLTKGLGDPEIIERVFTEAALRHGVSPDRLRFLPRTSDELTHRANLAIADVILDTYPYNGATTTLEVLWMGIPLVTRAGEQFAARNSYAFMHQVGLTEGIAWTDAEYIEWGIKLGTDANLRQKIRTKLHQSRQTSPLWNAKQFTRDMEQAYRQMWKRKQEEK